MIELCCTVEDDDAGPLSRRAFLTHLESDGLALQRVETPSGGAVCLMFAPLEAEAVRGLPAAARERVVLIAEGSVPAPADAEATRSATGFLGLVEPRAWRSWKAGLYVAWGLYGRPEVAREAGLCVFRTNGLQPVGTRDSLQSVVARFLAAAERMGGDRGTVAAQTQESAMIEVRADEAKANKLPAIGFRVDPQGVPLSLMKFPEAGKYLIASGPPGAPLLAIVWAADEREGDAGAIEKAIRRSFSLPFQQPLVIGDAGSVTIGGASRSALAFMTGQTLRKTAWCGVLVSTQAGSVLVTLGRSPGQAASMTCADVVAEPSLAAFARTFTVT